MSQQNSLWSHPVPCNLHRITMIYLTPLPPNLPPNYRRYIGQLVAIMTDTDMWGDLDGWKIEKVCCPDFQPPPRISFHGDFSILGQNTFSTFYFLNFLSIFSTFYPHPHPRPYPPAPRFVDAYGLRAEDVPVLVFTCDCERPFALGKLVPYDPCAV